MGFFFDNLTLRPQQIDIDLNVNGFLKLDVLMDTKIDSHKVTLKV